MKKAEYFGRYGKIHKCVLNQQGPVATAYATYVRDEVWNKLWEYIMGIIDKLLYQKQFESIGNLFK